jgi:hypothetical protein
MMLCAPVAGYIITSRPIAIGSEVPVPEIWTELKQWFSRGIRVPRPRPMPIAARIQIGRKRSRAESCRTTAA